MSPIGHLRRRAATRAEQVSQARRIHGGWLGLARAAAAVRLSRLPLPSERLRARLFRNAFARLYPPGIDEAEAERPIGSYRSFNALFTRGLRSEARPVPDDESLLVSPCDGTVQDVGRVERGQVVTVKGVAYSLASLLAVDDVGRFEGGRFAIIFLSPIDCHRVFSPASGRLEEAVHVPGYRLLVHPPFQRPEYPVYTLNERVILRVTTAAGVCDVVMVAGWGVGHITLPLAPEFRPGSRRVETHAWSPAPPVKRGDWIGTFELGSTVVLVTEGSAHAAPLVSPAEKVRYGQPVFRLEPPAGRE